MGSPRYFIVSPAGSAPRHDPVRPAAPVTDIGERHFAFLGNTKNNVDLLFARLGRQLQERYSATFEVTKKANSTVGAGPLIGELSARAHGIVSGMGD